MNKIIQGGLIFIGVMFLTFIIMGAVVEPIVQDAYQKGYERGKNETCKLYFPNQWTGDNPMNKNINVSVNFTLII